MKNMKRIIFLFIVLVPLLGSCASIYMKKSVKTAEAVTASLNKGDGQLPASWSTVPFVFDGEILVTTSLVSGLWDGIAGSGFTLKNPEITSVSPVTPEDYSLFRNSWEMQVLFRNKIPRFTYKVTVKGVKGEILLLIYRNEDRGYSIMGLKAEADS